MKPSPRRSGPTSESAAAPWPVLPKAVALATLLVLPNLAEMVLAFGPSEYAMLMLAGLAMVTYMSGGSLPLADGVILGMGKFNRILDIDYANRCITAQSGVTNLALSEAVAERDANREIARAMRQRER